MVVKTVKRIFTLGYAETVDALAGVTTEKAQTLIVAEEDIIILGYQASCKCPVGGFIANDGESDIDWILTTSGLTVGAGVVAFFNAHVVWNTVPAAITVSFPDLFNMFPQEKGISMKEGEVLQLTAAGHNNSAATVRHTVDGVIYYIKGTARS